MKTGFINYWWFDAGYGAHIKVAYSSRRHTANRFQAEHTANGWPVGRMKTVRVRLLICRDG
jgi:hypothetical protein